MQIISSTGYGITVKGLSNGVATITATFQNNQTTSKSIQVGNRILDTGVVSGEAVVDFSQTLTYYYYGEGLAAPATSYNWFIYGGINDGEGPDCGAQILSGQGTDSISLETGCISGYIIVEVTATSTTSTITTFPNPMLDSSKLEVNVVKTNTLEKNTLNVDSKTLNNEVKIYDFYGVLLYSMNFNSDKMALTNLNLKSGKYVLNVKTNSGEILRKVIFVK